VNWLLDSKRLTIDPSCQNSLAEFNQYRWQKRRDGETGDRYATSTPVDNHADAMDARRYALVWSVGAYASTSGRGKAVKMQWGR